MRRSNASKKPVFCTFGYVDYIVLASSIAIALGDELSTDDLNILATFFAVLADELALVSAVQSTCSDSGSDSDEPFPVPAVPGASGRYRSSCPKKNSMNKNINSRRKKVVRKKIKKKKSLD